jgi:hypothetical protein
LVILSLSGTYFFFNTFIHDFEEKMSLELAKKIWTTFTEEYYNTACHPGVIYAVVEKFPEAIHLPKRIWYTKKELK